MGLTVVMSGSTWTHMGQQGPLEGLKLRNVCLIKLDSLIAMLSLYHVCHLHHTVLAMTLKAE